MCTCMQQKQKKTGSRPSLKTAREMSLCKAPLFGKGSLVRPQSFHFTATSLPNNLVHLIWLSTNGHGIKKTLQLRCGQCIYNVPG